MNFRRYISIFLIAVIAPIACYGNIFRSMKDGAAFGAAIGKGGGDVRHIYSVMEEMYRLEDARQYYSASQMGVGLYAQFRQMGDDVLQTKVYARFLTYLSTDLNEVGISSAAIYYALEAEALFAKLVDEDDNDYIAAIKNLSVFYYSADDIAQSEMWLDRCLEIVTDNSNHRDTYCELLNTKACIYNHTGQPLRAIALEEQIIAEDKNPSPVWLKNLAQFRFNIGQTEQAIADMESMLALYQKQQKSTSNDYAAALRMLASYCQAADLDRAISLTQQAIDIMKRNSSTLNAQYAQALSDMATYHARKNLFPEAVAFEKRAQKILSKIASDNDPQRLSSQRSLALYQYYVGDRSSAETNLIASTRAFDDNIRYSMLQVGTARRNIWNSCKEWYINTIPRMAYHIGSDSLYATAYDAALLSKGLLLNTEVTLVRLADESPRVRQLYDEWQQAKSLLALPNDVEEINRLTALAEETEKQFMRECRLAGDQADRLLVRWQAVRQRLANDELAVEFVNFFAENDSTIYAALIVKPDMPTPTMVPLVALAEHDQLADRDPAELSALLWGGMEKYLSGVKNVYFSPAGELYNLPIESLPDWRDTGRLLSDTIAFYRCSSTRELVLSRAVAANRSAAVYGGLLYDMSVSDLSADARNYPAVRDFRISDNAFIDSLSTRASSRIVMPYLPGTKAEAENITTALGSSMPVDTYIGTKGTEASFKALSGKGTSLIHIATHGFYLSRDEADESAMLSLDSDNASLSIEDKALQRSGLLLSGANNRCSGVVLPDDVDDGILTAQEISMLDFRSLDLICLSACQTAQGDVTSDGVFGLQRGFKKAGAGSLLMSLWPVSDEATSILMTQFYHNLMSGLSTHAALEAAKAHLRSISRFDSLEYWAAFILLDALPQ